jgi:hypothetical protein
LLWQVVDSALAFGGVLEDVLAMAEEGWNVYGTGDVDQDCPSYTVAMKGISTWCQNNTIHKVMHDV